MNNNCKVMYRVFMLFVVVAIAACSGTVNKEKFKELNRAANTIRSAVSIGVNYNDFNKLIISYSAELKSLDG